ncbi:MAG: ABC transporter ATP-binding protein/permease [Proteobacteria bacterium]|nr:MAG: ABC transporter ATP-binding protein/permease [Pseudomonadota bacterium]
MKKTNSVSLSGKAGDVTSIDDVTRASERAIDQPPAEALIAAESKRPSDGIPAWKELKVLFAAMLKSPAARRIFLIIGAAVFVLVLNVIGEIRMNKWQGSFFRAIEHKNLHDVWKQAGTFVVIMLVLLSFVVTQNWLLERMKIRWREWLTGHLLDSWMAPGRAYRLNMTSAERLNPDQRIQEDVRNFSEMSGDLGMGALRSTLMLVSFVGVLWGMSRGISLPLFGRAVEVPGYMVWFALFYALLGSWAAARVGRPLINLNEERYTNEANLRYSLVRVSDNAESISFYNGERDERTIVNISLQEVLNTLRTLSFAHARLTWIACGHGWMVVILPVLVALPGFLQGKLDFGGLMMVVGAFNQVQQSLRWFVENFAKIADWRSSLHRVMAFRAAVQTVDEQSTAAGYIRLEPQSDDTLEFDKTSISLLDGEVVIADASAIVKPGERVLLMGESGSGKSTLFRAAGGLWPWGSGAIKLPPKEDIMFLPQKPYIPLGTLAAALAYPNSSKVGD